MTDLMIIVASSNNNLKLSKRLEEMSIEKGFSPKFLNVEDLDLPLYTTPTKEEIGIPEIVMKYSKIMTDTKSFLFVAPEYNGSMPPSLSNFIAWISLSTKDYMKIFSEKPIGLATHSGGGLAGDLMLSMRLQFKHLGGNILGREIITTPKKDLSIDAAKRILEQLKK